MYTVQEIAASLGVNAAGDVSLKVKGAAEPALATADDLAMAMSPAYADHLSKGSARAAVLWEGADWQDLSLEAAIFVSRPRMAMAGITRMLDPGQGFPPGIHPTAVVDETAELGREVTVGAFTIIGARAVIGDGSVIGPQCFIGADTKLGRNASLREMVSIGARAQIGSDFIAQPGVRIGGDGFSFVTPEISGVENARKSLGDQGDAQPQAWQRIHSLGSVTIGDNVEIGSNSTVDNGTVRNTEIGSGTKLDSLVQVGHNVRIGRDCLLCAQAGVAGSVIIGDNVVLGGQSGVADNITVGDRVVAAGGTKLLSNVPAGRVMMGYPAVKMESFTALYKAQRRLPRFLSDLAELKKAVFKSESSK